MSAQIDPFTLFDLPRRYEIDRGALEAAYERLTLAHHPDFFAAAPAAERQAAERTAAAVNEGYRVLRDDGERAAYLLRLLADGRKLDTTALPPGFLQEMFGLQEEVEELGEDGSPERKAELRNEANAKRETILAERATLFAQATAGGGTGAEGTVGEGPAGEGTIGEGPIGEGTASLEPLQAIQGNLNCERYLLRLLERLDGHRDD